MTRNEYMARFSLAARWFLPPKEAAETVADYESLFAGSGEKELEVCHALGDSVKAAHLLREGRSYRVWMVAFCLMALCALIPAYHLFHTKFIFSPYLYLWSLGIVGGLTAIVWFRRRSRSPRPLPKGLLPTLGGLLLAAALTAGLATFLCVRLWEKNPGGILGGLLGGCLQGMGVLSLLVCLTGLALGRLADRRWRAAYLLGLNLLLVCCLLLAHLRSMNTAGASPLAQLCQIAAGGLAGIVLSGVALC